MIKMLLLMSKLFTVIYKLWYPAVSDDRNGISICSIYKLTVFVPWCDMLSDWIAPSVSHWMQSKLIAMPTSVNTLKHIVIGPRINHWPDHSTLRWLLQSAKSLMLDLMQKISKNSQYSMLQLLMVDRQPYCVQFQVVWTSWKESRFCSEAVSFIAITSMKPQAVTLHLARLKFCFEEW